MNEMTNEGMGVLRTRGMKVVHGVRGADAAFEPGVRERKAAGAFPEKRERTEQGGPGGLAGWVLGLIARREGAREARHLRVLETQTLGGRRQLMLVMCDGERYLIGTGADRVDTIVRVGDGVQSTASRTAAPRTAAIPVEEPWL